MNNQKKYRVCDSSGVSQGETDSIGNAYHNLTLYRGGHIQVRDNGCWRELIESASDANRRDTIEASQQCAGDVL